MSDDVQRHQLPLTPRRLATSDAINLLDKYFNLWQLHDAAFHWDVAWSNGFDVFDWRLVRFDDRHS